VRERLILSRLDHPRPSPAPARRRQHRRRPAPISCSTAWRGPRSPATAATRRNWGSRPGCGWCRASAAGGRPAPTAAWVVHRGPEARQHPGLRRVARSSCSTSASPSCCPATRRRRPSCPSSPISDARMLTPAYASPGADPGRAGHHGDRRLRPSGVLLVRIDHRRPCRMRRERGIARRDGRRRAGGRTTERPSRRACAASPARRRPAWSAASPATLDPRRAHRPPPRPGAGATPSAGGPLADDPRALSWPARADRRPGRHPPLPAAEVRRPQPVAGDRGRRSALAAAARRPSALALWQAPRRPARGAGGPTPRPAPRRARQVIPPLGLSGSPIPQGSGGGAVTAPPAARREGARRIDAELAGDPV